MVARSSSYKEHGLNELIICNTTSNEANKLFTLKVTTLHLDISLSGGFLLDYR